MVGYRKNPEANAESFYQAAGKRFFRTGDMGRMVEGRFLKITGERTLNNFVSSIQLQ